MIVLLFWVLLYTPGSTVVQPRTVLAHGMTFAFELLDTIVTNPPLYLKQFLYPELFAGAYVLFSLVYWAAGGTGANGAVPYIYGVLDWGSSPGIAVAYCLGVLLVVAPLLYLFLWGVSLAAKRGRVAGAADAGDGPLPTTAPDKGGLKTSLL